ncbi:hypothetical protein [Pseudomonas monteilii]|uniref:hypothetical protein n=1 Tax=Pseudomonas monteilii TaxID=76759 RepID=UPI003F6DE903
MSEKEEQLKAAREQLVKAEAELASAHSAREQWEQYDMVREDGSMAQDRRHEESGEYRLECIREAAESVRNLRALIASLT